MNRVTESYDEVLLILYRSNKVIHRKHLWGSIEVIKFFHLILTMTLAGGMVASYYYVATAVNTQIVPFILFTLRFSLLLDCILFLPILLIAFATGTSLTLFEHIPFTTPWIISAYLLSVFAVILWFISFVIKSFNYSFVINEDGQSFKFLRTFHVSNSLFILCMILIVHDAVRKQTFLWYG